jgi:uncharacterized protein (TIGR04222 family)
MSIFDYTGPEFLSFYYWAFGAAVILAWGLPQLLRFPVGFSYQQSELDPFEVAYLKGGHTEVLRAAIASLWHRGLISLSQFTRELRRNPEEAPLDLMPMERHLLNQIGRSSKIDLLMKGDIAPVSVEKLREEGLVLSLPMRLFAWLLRSAPLIVLLIIGIVKINVGMSRGKPVSYLFFACVITAGAAIFCACKPVKRTFRGDQLLRTLKKDHSALCFSSRRRAIDMIPADAALSVALFGIATGAFGTELPQALQPPRVVTGSGSGGCSSSGCGGGGGGGCGGGGCGGCGG